MNCSRYLSAMLRTLSLAGVVGILVSAGGAYAHANDGHGGKGKVRSETLRTVNTIHPIIVGRLHREPGDGDNRHPYPGRSPIRGPLPPQPAPVAAGSVM